MKKVLLTLAVIMGMGVTMVFAQDPITSSPTEQTPQTSKVEFTQIDVNDLPREVVNSLSQKYTGLTIKEAYVAEEESGKVFKIILLVSHEDQKTDEVTILLNEKGEEISA